MPEISVIVPVYKAENYIRRCVDSILAQIFMDFELILVNDGSPDSSGNICDEYAKKTAVCGLFTKKTAASPPHEIPGWTLHPATGSRLWTAMIMYWTPICQTFTNLNMT